MDGCLFCSIASGQKSGHIIYKDEAVTAMLDVFPRAIGHTLVVPNRHMETLLEMRPDEMAPFWEGVQKALSMLNSSLKPQGFTIGINHGKVSGQAIEHLHVHLIPRFEGDGGGSIHSIINNPSTQPLEEVWKKITGRN
jgi:histidine triad (HIT) family protein